MAWSLASSYVLLRTFSLASLDLDCGEVVKKGLSLYETVQVPDIAFCNLLRLKKINRLE